MISILYEEPHFLVVNKPAALFSQAAEPIDSLQRRLVQQLKDRDNHSGEPFVGLPHRLDRGTSGIMLIARNQRALKRFGEQFQSRKVVKHYLAIVEGEFPRSMQTWEDYVRKVVDEPLSAIVPSTAEGAKLARAKAVGLYCEALTSLVQVQLETGRMHQIRIQASARGFPVVGDRAYGAKLGLCVGQTSTDETHAHPPLALHAWMLQFRHPQTAKSMTFTAPVPDSWSILPAGRFARSLPATGG